MRPDYGEPFDMAAGDSNPKADLQVITAAWLQPLGSALFLGYLRWALSESKKGVDQLLRKCGRCADPENKKEIKKQASTEHRFEVLDLY